MFSTCQSPALWVMMTDQHTLLPIMQWHLQNGTIMYSDEWRAYNRVQQLPSVAQHGTILDFVNPATDVHTHNIGSYWNLVKTKFKQMRGFTSRCSHLTWMNSCGGSGTGLVNGVFSIEPLRIKFLVCDPTLFQKFGNAFLG